MTNIIDRKIRYYFSETAKGSLLLPDTDTIKFSQSNGTSWLVVNDDIKKLNPDTDFEYLAYDIEHRGLCKDNIYLEFEGKKIDYAAVLIRQPIAKKSENWQDTAHKWQVTINGQIFEFHTGIAHRDTEIPFTLNQIIGKYKISINDLIAKYTLETILRCSKASKPSIDDVLYSLVSDTYCGEYTFPDFCSNLGYDTDSRKALETYLACQQNGEKLRKTGLNIAKLQDAFQDY